MSAIIPGGKFSSPTNMDYDALTKRINTILNTSAQFNGQVGFFGHSVTSQPAGFTINYTTASRSFGGYASNPQSTAFSGIANTVSGTVYAQVSDLNTLRTAYENLRVMTESLLAMFNQLVQDMETLGLEK